MSWHSLSRWSALLMLGQALILSYIGPSGISPASSVGIAAMAFSTGALLFGIMAAIAAWRRSARHEAVLLVLATTAYPFASVTMLAFCVRYQVAFRPSV